MLKKSAGATGPSGLRLYLSLPN